MAIKEWSFFEKRLVIYFCEFLKITICVYAKYKAQQLTHSWPHIYQQDSK